MTRKSGNGRQEAKGKRSEEGKRQEARSERGEVGEPESPIADRVAAIPEPAVGEPESSIPEAEAGDRQSSIDNPQPSIPDAVEPPPIVLPGLRPLKQGVHIMRHLELQLDVPQRENLRRLYDALQEGAVKMANGRVVNTPTDAARWLLEQVGR